MTVRELAAALASLPDQWQDKPVAVEEHGDYIEVRTLKHVLHVHTPGQLPVTLVELTGWIQPGHSNELYRQPDPPAQTGH